MTREQDMAVVPSFGIEILPRVVDCGGVSYVSNHVHFYSLSLDECTHLNINIYPSPPLNHPLLPLLPPPTRISHIKHRWQLTAGSVPFQIQKLGSCLADAGSRETSGNLTHTEFHRDKTKDTHAESCCSADKSGQQLPWFEHMKNVSQFAEPTEMSLVPDTGKGAKSLVELLVSNRCF